MELTNFLREHKALKEWLLEAAQREQRLKTELAELSQQLDV